MYRNLSFYVVALSFFRHKNWKWLSCAAKRLSCAGMCLHHVLKKHIKKANHKISTNHTCSMSSPNNNNAADTGGAIKAVDEALARNSKLASEIFASVCYFMVNF